MRTRVLLPIFLLLHSLQLLAQQNPLIGAWQAVSFKGTASSGRKINAEGSFRETKIFSDTHYILITHIQKGDLLVFEKATAGTFRVEGNKYIETPQYASDPNILLEKNNFTYTLEEGHRFIQSGTYTTADGKTGKIEELIFQKVKEDKVTSPLAGSWKHIQSSAYEDASGFEIETLHNG